MTVAAPSGATVLDEPRPRPNGPWMLVALASPTVAVVSACWATTVPADARWLWLTAVAVAVGVGSLVVACRRPPDGFAGRWSATFAVTLTVAGVVLLRELPVAGPATLILFVLFLAVPALALLAILLIVVSLVRTRVDGLVALALAVGTPALLLTTSTLELRLRGGPGDRLAAEATNLAADPDAPEAMGGSDAYPTVLAETDRTVVVWELARFDTQTPLLVHDPDGVVSSDKPPGGMVDCEPLFGPWWTCAFG